MCEKCEFDHCEDPGMDRCMICNRCYCIMHMGSDGYCIDCFFGTGLFD